MKDQFVHAQMVMDTFKKTGRKLPNLQDTVSFMVTEAVEALDEVLRMKPEYVRNHPRTPAVDGELADTYMMLLLAARIRGIDLEMELAVKLERMEKNAGS